MSDLSLPTVQVLERALTILEVLVREPSGLGISEISGITQLPVSTVHRLLKVLKKRGYVLQDIPTRKYLPALRMQPIPRASESIQEASGHAV